MEFKHWLLLNLRDPNYFPIAGADWNVLFGSILWILWCNQNARIFSADTGDPGGVLQRSQHLLEESMRARLPLCSSVLPGLLEMQHRRWEVQFRFVRRDGNVPADIMARLAWQGSLGYHRYLEPPVAVRDALLRDAARPATVMV
ncbi:hypothetical protein V6N11_052437 [Hibiscus sabdariffa]|uniref:RNase H type-1 domain-containing protein n=1 Tax=Hibiscus sabdariffa TaxID=183260 RepID=A0ABR2UA66_9ROSI